MEHWQFILFATLALVLGVVSLCGGILSWPARQARFAVVIGIGCLVSTVFFAVGIFLPWERGIILGSLLTMDVLLIGSGAKGLSDFRHCSVPVTAVCVGIQQRGAGRSRSYSPELSYSFGGAQLRSVCSSAYVSRRRAEKRFPLGETVTVFADPDQPDLTVDKRRLPAASVWLTVVGCACLAFTVYACFGDVGIR